MHKATCQPKTVLRPLKNTAPARILLTDRNTGLTDGKTQTRYKEKSVLKRRNATGSHEFYLTIIFTICSVKRPT